MDGSRRGGSPLKDLTPITDLQLQQCLDAFTTATPLEYCYPDVLLQNDFRPSPQQSTTSVDLTGQVNRWLSTVTASQDATDAILFAVNTASERCQEAFAWMIANWRACYSLQLYKRKGNRRRLRMRESQRTSFESSRRRGCVIFPPRAQSRSS